MNNPNRPCHHSIRSDQVLNQNSPHAPAIRRHIAEVPTSLKNKVALITGAIQVMGEQWHFASEIDSSYITGEVLTLLGGETTAG